MLTAVHPKLPMRSKQTTQDYYVNKLGFKVWGSASHQDYLMIEKEGIQLHFFLYEALNPLENYGQVYIRTTHIDALYEKALQLNLAMPRLGHLGNRPWGQREFSLLDPDHNLLTFGESI